MLKHTSAWPWVFIGFAILSGILEIANGFWSPSIPEILNQWMGLMISVVIALLATSFFEYCSTKRHKKEEQFKH